MFKNYLLISLRSLQKHRSYSVINIAGLGLGLATCLLLVTWVVHELRYDTFHEHASRIQRVSLEYSFGGQTSRTAVSPTALLPTLQKNFAEVENGVRIYNPSSWNPFVVKHDDKIFQEEKFFYADSTFFQVFTFPLVMGNTATALTEPNTVVLTRNMAKKYFGEAEALGKTLKINNNTEYLVTGVIDNVPSNSLLQFDFIASFASLPASKEQIWWSANYQTFVLLQPGTNEAALSDKTQTLVKEALANELTNPGDYVKYNFMPLTDIYLRSDMDEATPVGNIQYVYIFGAIAFLVLAIACINYVNLATARAADRAKEVGIRKVIGALRQQLLTQFIGESVIITLIALALSFFLARLALPAFESITGKSFAGALLFSPAFMGGALLVSIIIAMVAGAYPALAITSFKPVSVLKGNFKTSGKGVWLRQGLVVFQFGISIILIIGTLVVIKQLNYLQEKKLGYDKDNTVILPLDQKTASVYTALKSEILRSGAGRAVARATESPTVINGGYSLNLKGSTSDRGMIVTAMSVDDAFIPALGIELVAGRNFVETDAATTKADTTGASYTFVVNESTLHELALPLDKAVGTPVDMNGRKGEIIGVAKDFHFAPLHKKIAPLVLFNEDSQYSFLFVKLNGNPTEALSKLEKICKTTLPHRPFEYTFLDQQYNALYANEQRMKTLSTTFAGITIVIACLGLFGLVAFSAAQKTKEIGIRKVLGATAVSIVFLITRDFSRLVLLAIVMGLPVAYWMMHNWLNDFAYRTEIGVWPVLASALVCLAIAYGTAAFQAIKAALINPADTLRNE
ncbi:ABC transporter permease [Chryseolinea lacunae]|uniref:ABC transporter permease n=1 Tax=Chryseolinea lacunae TaxID=2801331 RepID=A0ABS1KKN3_9BACT|nr:ABC transporter permease [Chryseolinea lacunae]MBL0739787.1 ABC transporter permease [Chryseolinea lacunae]